MRQNAVAPRLPQRNELISPRFQWAFFVHLGKVNDPGGREVFHRRQTPGDFAEITKYSRADGVSDQKARSSGQVEKTITVPNSEWDEQPSRSCATHDSANDANLVSLN